MAEIFGIMSSDEDKEKTTMTVDNVHIYIYIVLLHWKDLFFYEIYIWILSTITVVFSLYIHIYYIYSYIHTHIYIYIYDPSCEPELYEHNPPNNSGREGALVVCIPQIKGLEHREGRRLVHHTATGRQRWVWSCSSCPSSCSQAPAVLSYKGDFLTPLLFLPF